MALLTDDEFTRPARLDHGSAYKTSLHLLVVDWGWRDFCMGNDDDSYPDGWPFPDLSTIVTFWTEEHARLLDYVATIDDDALAEPLTWQSEGAAHSAPRWAILLHIVNHGTQHRSELARYLTDCGHSPGDLDLV
jgi:uncharacterized damage-inducible protein DinB